MEYCLVKNIFMVVAHLHYGVKMIKQLKKIISVKSTSNNKTFILSTNNGIETYYANIEKTTDETKDYYNKNCLFGISVDNNRRIITDEIYTSLYNLSSFYIKSALYSKLIDTTFPDSRNFLNIYNYKKQNSKIINQIQVGDTIYQLNTSNTLGKTSLLSDIYYWHTLKNNNMSGLTETKLSTTILSANDNIKNISDITQLDVDVNKTNRLSALAYNQIIEIPGYVKNDYDSGNFAANVFKTKNHLNGQYSMSHSYSNDDLQNIRQYIAIDHCNDQIYLKYYDNISCSRTGQISYNDSCQYSQKYQRVEVISNVNRYEQTTQHKTNFYDIDVVCEKLFNSLNTSNSTINSKIQKIKSNLKLEIANMVKDICKQITPIDTQLIQVNVFEKEIEV